MNMTVNQHHVWQHHLRAWANEGDKIWCQKKNNGHSFCSNTRNVASQRFFYEHFKLLEPDIVYLNKLIANIKRPLLRELAAGWLEISQAPFKMYDMIMQTGASDEVKEAARVALDRAKKTMGEDLHGSIEDDALPILNALRSGDGDFFSVQEEDDTDGDEEDDGDEATDDALTFCVFIAFQYFRTVKMRVVVDEISRSVGHDAKRVWPIESLIYSTTVGWAIYEARAKYRLIFLNSPPGSAFITGDQPVINLRDESDSWLELFFPLSPSTAVILAPEDNVWAADSLTLSSAGVADFNRRMHGASSKQIYGKSQEHLTPFRVTLKNQ